MLDGVQGAGRTGDLAAGGREQQRSLGDRINDVLSWASPDGIILHALQPVLADGLRHLGVKLPDWAPSAEAASAKLQAAGSAIGQYLAGVAHNPAKLGDDIKGWIGANWNSLKADHAKAAAPGPDAEAKWWGQVAGRATFEIAAVVVPATKFATVAKAGEALELALRVGKLGELWGAAVKAGKVAEVVAEARSAGRLTELVAEARKTTGGIEALASRGKLSFDEVGAFQKGGTISAAEAHVASPNVIALTAPIAAISAADDD